MIQVLKLTNGKKVGNFSSAHTYEFEDGCILPAHTKEYATRYKIEFIENELEHGDIELSFKLTPYVKVLMERWMDMKTEGMVDVVYCPLPMIQGIRELYGKRWLLKSPFRAIRRANDDRTRNIISISKQCI